MTEHTPEPWELCSEGRSDGYDLWHKGVFAGIDWGLGAPTVLEPDDLETFKANARRIVAAVNATAGIPTEALEADVVRRMRNLLQDCFVLLELKCGNTDSTAQPTPDAARALLKALDT